MTVLGARNEIDAFAMETIRAVHLLIKENLDEQAMVLLYSAIDRLSWVNLANGDVESKDFCAWADKYIEPNENLGCTSKELYAARCGILHSGAAESRLSRETDCRELFYAYAEETKKIIDEYFRVYHKRIHVISPSVLAGWFCIGAYTFSDEIEANCENKQVYLERVKKWISFRTRGHVITEMISSISERTRLEDSE